jgi:hypothetical protein
MYSLNFFSASGVRKVPSPIARLNKCRDAWAVKVPLHLSLMGTVTLSACKQSRNFEDVSIECLSLQWDRHASAVLVHQRLGINMKACIHSRTDSRTS